MPFKPPYAGYFATFYRPSLEATGYRAFRAWGGLSNEDYCDLLLKLIGKSGMVWADVSELNYNVLYEIGAAHALGKLSMLVVAESEARAVPANIGRDAVVRYSTADQDWPEGTVLMMAALITSLTLAAERGQRLRVSPESVEGALAWAGHVLEQTLVPPEAREAVARGRELLAAGDVAGAESQFDDAIGLGLDDALTRLGRGIARVSLEKYADAEADLAAAVDDPDQSDDAKERRALAHYFRGLARQSQDNHAGAREDYDAAISLGYAAVEVYERRAEVRELSGDQAGAQTDRERALALAQETAPAQEPDEPSRRER
jgi:tetratricopeptide (TPR) repeat protein